MQTAGHSLALKKNIMPSELAMMFKLACTCTMLQVAAESMHAHLQHGLHAGSMTGAHKGQAQRHRGKAGHFHCDICVCDQLRQQVRNLHGSTCSLHVYFCRACMPVLLCPLPRRP